MGLQLVSLRSVKPLISGEGGWMRILDDSADQCKPLQVLQRSGRWRGLFLALILSLFAGSVSAEDAIPPPVMPAPPVAAPKTPEVDIKQTPVEKISEGVYRIGKVTVDQKKRELPMEGSVNMQEGLVEYLAVAEKGKLHEAVLIMNVEPLHLQLGLILLGLKYGRNLKYQGEPADPIGDPVNIFVEWGGEGRKKRVRGEDLILNQQTEKSMSQTHWIFSGSFEVGGVFAAQLERSLIATYHDPASIIDNPLPEGADDTILYVNKELVPPVGTQVTLTIQAAKPYRR